MLVSWIFHLLLLHIYIYLQLYSQIALNVAYMIFAVFGWAMWSESRKHHEPSVVKVWSYRTHAIFGGVIFLLSWMAPNIMVNWLSQEQAFLDVLLVVASLLATTLTVFRVLESWLYWIVINLLSIYLYWQQGDWMTIMLFSIYASFAVYGWIYWRKIRKQDVRQFNRGVVA